MQEMAYDGTLTALLAPVMRPDDAPPYPIWPGGTRYYGFSVAAESTG
jgi:hypothetical protein